MIERSSMMPLFEGSAAHEGNLGEEWGNLHGRHGVAAACLHIMTSKGGAGRPTRSLDGQRGPVESGNRIKLIFEHDLQVNGFERTGKFAHQVVEVAGNAPAPTRMSNHVRCKDSVGAASQIRLRLA
eukprot:scaffold91036_cov27-Tisochrysis_lutea.AAC.6